MARTPPIHEIRFGRMVIASAVLLAACGSSDDAATPESGTPSSITTDLDIDSDIDSDTDSDADSGTDSGDGSGDGADVDQGPAIRVFRGDLGRDGNRILQGRGRLGETTPIDVPLPATPVRIMPVADAARFVVVLEGETVLVVDPSGAVEPVGPIVAADPQPDGVVFDDPLPDGRTVSNGEVAAALVQPTDRYPHGVLGDRIEAAAVAVVDLETGDRTVFGPEPPTVIEGIQPMLVDVDGDGTDEVLVTESNAEVGARLAVWSLDGDVVVRSEPIGQGNRWRNQLAVAPTGPAGEIEIIDVRTPHLGGTLQYFRIDGDELERVAFTTGYTSHEIGSRNLDLGIVADGDGDGRLDVVLPNDRRTELGVVTRTGGDAETTVTVPLPGRLTTNVTAAAVGGDLWFAAGTDDDVLRIWPGG